VSLANLKAGSRFEGRRRPLRGVDRSQFAGSNQAAAVIGDVGGNIEGVVKELKDKGVAFEHYDMPDMTRKGDIHKAGPMKAAWFKDPDGNIHALISE
jgi:hypothetical protein